MCKCGSDEVAYVYSDMLIKRYKMVCVGCGRYLKWLSNKDWVKIQDIVIAISQEKHKQIVNDYYKEKYGG